MERSNFKKTNYGILVVMIPLSTEVGIYSEKLVMVRGVRYETFKQCCIVHYSQWKVKKYLSHFLRQDNLNRNTITKYFTTSFTVELTTVRLV